MRENIIGHDDQIRSLQKTIEEKSISHSYLFQGEEGIGKKKVAMFFAKTLLCKEEGLSPCGKCGSCIKFETSNHPDFTLVEPDKNIIRKAQIDEIVDSMKSLPFESNYKIFVIDDSHRMNMESMNGLLKTLEEPPEFLIMILITSSWEELLPTVRSRCQGINFYPIRRDEMSEYLTGKRGINERDAAFISSFSEGSMGIANELLESDELFESREKVLSIIDSLISGNKSAAFTNIDFFEENKKDIDQLLNIIIFWFRDLAVYKETKNMDLLINSDKIQLFDKQSHVAFEHINDIIENVEYTRQNIKSNVNYVLSIEMMLLNIQEDNQC